MKILQNLVRVHNDHSIAAILAIVFCLTQLSGCGIVGSNSNWHPASYDGPPSVDIDVSKINDAVPKVEPLHPYGTRDYVVAGRRYRVLKSAKGYVKRGYASWYGSKFHGQETSTQEKYNLYAMTAASPELPLPSYAKVTNLRNGKTVVVRINDRGPFHSKRILDLSYAAAKKLGFADTGVAPVKIVGIDPRALGKTKSPALSSTGIFLQVGAFTKLANAEQLSNKVNKLIDKPIKIKRKSDLYCVQIGPLASSTQSSRLKDLLEQHGFEHVTIVEG